MSLPNLSSAREFAKIVLRSHQDCPVFCAIAMPIGFTTLGVDEEHYPLMVDQAWRDEVTRLLSNFSCDAEFIGPVDPDYESWSFVSEWRS